MDAESPPRSADRQETPPEDVRVVAVDWSGAGARPQDRIWLAEVRQGRLVRLESGRDRSQLVAHLVEEVDRGGELVVGLDFGFSFPAWFCRELGAASVEDVWRAAAGDGESWLKECSTPFWGRPGRKRPQLTAHFRKTEEVIGSVTGTRPKSVFQIGGAGAVGTGSIRGMPHLLTLAAAGFSVFPFHTGRLPAVLEIYPRVLTGPVVKSSQGAREAYLAKGLRELDPRQKEEAAASEDAFDAAVSAVMMARHLGELVQAVGSGGLARGAEALEGRIWVPTGA